MKSYQTFLMDQLSERKRRNPQFSLRAFAKVLDMSPAHLSSLINGKKTLTPKQASKIISKIAPSDYDTSHLLKDLLPEAITFKKDSVENKLISEDEMRLISEWYHFAILSLSHLKENKANSKWIAQRLGIDPVLAMEACQRLQRLGLLEIKEGRLKQISKPLTTTTNIPSQAIRHYHKQNLQIAQDKIETVSVDKRYYTSTTMAIDPKKIEKAKTLMEEFRQKINDELTLSENLTEVYTIALQLFPLTQ